MMPSRHRLKTGPAELTVFPTGWIEEVHVIPSRSFRNSAIKVVWDTGPRLEPPGTSGSDSGYW